MVETQRKPGAGRIFRLLTAVLAFSAITFAMAGAAYAETVYIEGKSGKFRSGPGTNYKVLWEAPRYTPVEFLAKFQNWYALRDKDGDVGWVHDQVVAKGKAAVVVAKKADVRKGPGKNNPVVFTVERRYLFKALEEKKDWIKVVDADGDGGWIAKEAVWLSR